MTEHSLSRQRRLELGIARGLSRTIGAGPAGKLWTLMSRLRLAPSDLKTYYVLSTSPLIIYLGNRMEHTFEIAEVLRHRPVTFIKNSYHTFELEHRLNALTEEVNYFRDHFPLHTIHFICPTEREREMFVERGLTPCHFINKNCLVDESLFNVLPNVPKEFDAVHNGQLKPYKRHELAEQVEDLALIVYRHSVLGVTEEANAYGDQIRSRLSQATWLNDIGSRIPPCEISPLLNRARVGLCLSAEEGPMAASMEYLLCGLSIVSTRSLGGREVFFDDEYVKIVDDSPEAVADGVREMVARDVPPLRVREKTLELVNHHRARFISLVESILQEHGDAVSFEPRFSDIFSNKLRLSSHFPGGFLTHVTRGMPIQLCRTMAQQQIS